LWTFGECAANSHVHVPRRVLVDFDVAGELARAEALLGVEHQDDGQKPLLKVQMGVVEDRIDRDAERCVTGVAVVAPVVLGLSDAVRRAVGADRTPAPADALDMGETGGFSWEALVNADDVGWFLGHLATPSWDAQKCSPTAWTCQLP